MGAGPGVKVREGSASKLQEDSPSVDAPSPACICTCCPPPPPGLPAPTCPLRAISELPCPVPPPQGHLPTWGSTTHHCSHAYVTVLSQPGPGPALLPSLKASGQASPSRAPSLPGGFQDHPAVTPVPHRHHSLQECPQGCPGPASQDLVLCRLARAPPNPPPATSSSLVTWRLTRPGPESVLVEGSPALEAWRPDLPSAPIAGDQPAHRCPHPLARGQKLGRWC